MQRALHFLWLFVLTKGQITIDSDLWLVEAKEKYIKRSFLCYLIKTQWQKDNISMLMCPKRPHFTRPWHNFCGRFFKWDAHLLPWSLKKPLMLSGLWFLWNNNFKDLWSFFLGKFALHLSNYMFVASVMFHGNHPFHLNFSSTSCC